MTDRWEAKAREMMRHAIRADTRGEPGGSLAVLASALEAAWEAGQSEAGVLRGEDADALLADLESGCGPEEARSRREAARVYLVRAERRDEG